MTNDTVNIIGIRRDGSSEVLGTTLMGPKHKAREIVQSMLGPIDEDMGNEAAYALWCCGQLVDWLSENKLLIAPIQLKD